jgi:hypothetical protein
MCPNDKRMKNIKKTFHKISMEKIELALEEVGLTGEENEII